jgi:hypothetical protein
MLLLNVIPWKYKTRHLLSFHDIPGCDWNGCFCQVIVDRVRVAAVIDHGKGRVERVSDVPGCSVEPVLQGT